MLGAASMEAAHLEERAKQYAFSRVLGPGWICTDSLARFAVFKRAMGCSAQSRNCHCGIRWYPHHSRSLRALRNIDPRIHRMGARL